MKRDWSALATSAIVIVGAAIVGVIVIASLGCGRGGACKPKEPRLQSQGGAQPNSCEVRK